MTVEPGAWWIAALSGVIGGLFGILLAWCVQAWFRFTDEAGVSRRSAALVAVMSALAVIALWRWEVCRGGQLPGSLTLAEMAAGRWDLLPRCIAHLMLFWLLAAATWIDLRQRVIPDWITIPGAIIGLGGAWAWPEMLLPIAVEVPRTFATPSITTDVLAWYGPLRAGTAGMFGPAPAVAGAGIVVAIFVWWWAVCTEPAVAVHSRRLPSPRGILLGAGLLAIGLAWWMGGVRFAALQSALVGLAVSGGLVWLTRAGASRALGREAMGLGDVTLMAMTGAWLGWQACVLAFFLAAFIGLGHGVVQMLRHHDNELPFGPSLCLATTIVVVAWRPAWQAAAVHFEQPGQLAVVVAAVVVMTAVTLFLLRSLRGL